MKNKSGYIYFVLNNNMIKIGRTKNIKQRLKTFKTTMPFMRVLAVYLVDNMYEAEKFYHDKFKKHKIKGEWYNSIIMYEEVK